MTDEKGNMMTYWGGLAKAQQAVSPDQYANLNLPDQWVEDIMQEQEAAWIVEQTADCNRICDLGWGSGIVAKALHNAGREVHVVDGSHEFVSNALDAGIITHLSMFEDFVPPHRYDCVIASFILEHVQDPTCLLMRARSWSDRLIVVIGNANSYHRQLAVAMGLQPRLDTLSARDIAVGHYVVFDRASITRMLHNAGWIPTLERGLMLKCLPNSILQTLDPRVIKAMCEVEVAPDVAGNVGLVCRAL